MDIGKMLSNPWVLGAGAAIGVVLLLSSTSGGGSDSGNSGQLAIWNNIQNNQAAVAQASMQTAGQLEGARINAGVQTSVAAMTLMSQLANVNAVQSVQLAEVRAGVTKTIAATNAAVTIDRTQNFTRLGMAYVESDKAKYLSDNAVTTASIQAKTARKLSDNALIGGIVGDVTGLAAKALPFL